VTNSFSSSVRRFPNASGLDGGEAHSDGFWQLVRDGIYDADTQATAQSTLGRALATFHTPNDDPSVNTYGDANFLRTRLYNYVAAIQA